MSLDPFPERIDAKKLFARNGILAAALPLAKLERLTDSLHDDSGVVAVNLLFGMDEDNKRLLTGTLDASVKVLCQRCLQEMELGLYCTLRLKVCSNEQELQDLPDTEDGIIMEGDELDILEVIEDELILSLPLVPVHADINCNAFLNALTQAETGAISKDKNAAGEKQNPFSILTTLKDKQKD